MAAATELQAVTMKRHRKPTVDPSAVAHVAALLAWLEKAGDVIAKPKVYKLDRDAWIILAQRVDDVAEAVGPVLARVEAARLCVSRARRALRGGKIPKAR